MLQKIIRQVNK